MTNTIEVPFDIEDVEVINIESKAEQLIITVKSTIEGTCCHKCGATQRHFMIMGMFKP